MTPKTEVQHAMGASIIQSFGWLPVLMSIFAIGSLNIWGTLQPVPSEFWIFIDAYFVANHLLILTLCVAASIYLARLLTFGLEFCISIQVPSGTTRFLRRRKHVKGFIQVRKAIGYIWFKPDFPRFLTTGLIGFLLFSAIYFEDRMGSLFIACSLTGLIPPFSILMLTKNLKFQRTEQKIQTIFRIDKSAAVAILTVASTTSFFAGYFSITDNYLSRDFQFQVESQKRQGIALLTTGVGILLVDSEPSSNSTPEKLDTFYFVTYDGRVLVHSIVH
ncbi:MAG: hypothetical protein ACPGUX_01805 [Halocynthiibacter sp.]